MQAGGLAPATTFIILLCDSIFPVKSFLQGLENRQGNFQGEPNFSPGLGASEAQNPRRNHHDPDYFPFQGIPGSFYPTEYYPTQFNPYEYYQHYPYDSYPSPNPNYVHPPYPFNPDPDHPYIPDTDNFYPYEYYPYGHFPEPGDPHEYPAYPFYPNEPYQDPYHPYKHTSYPYYPYGPSVEPDHHYPYYPYGPSVEPDHHYPYYPYGPYVETDRPYPYYPYGPSVEPDHPYPYYPYGPSVEPDHSYPYYPYGYTPNPQPNFPYPPYSYPEDHYYPDYHDHPFSSAHNHIPYIYPEHDHPHTVSEYMFQPPTPPRIKRSDPLTRRFIPYEDTDQGCEWHMVFKAVEGSGRDVYTDFTTSGDINANVAGAMNISSIMTYRDGSLLDKWENLVIEQVKIELFERGVRKTWFLFDGLGSTLESWLDDTTLIASPYLDLKSGGFEAFSVEGETATERRFYIHRTTASCTDDCGYLAVVDPQAAVTCPWEGGDLPLFIYSVLTDSCGRYNLEQETLYADRFVIFIKVCDIDLFPE